jgi:anaerobic selenocysteine-containing dehydrogenase
VADPSDERPAGGFEAVASTAREAARHGPARVVRALTRVNREGGFDCPGCAWPEPHRRGLVEFCENGAKAVAHEATRARVGPELFERFSVDVLLEHSDHWLEQQGRLTHPMRRRPGAEHYEPVSWDDALARIGEVLGSLDSPDQAVFYTSGRTSNEAAFLYQLMVRSFGTNNLPDCSNLCHESSGTGLSETIGVSAAARSSASTRCANAGSSPSRTPRTRASGSGRGRRLPRASSRCVWGVTSPSSRA